MTSDIFDIVNKSFIGFEPMTKMINDHMQTLQKAVNYPPYNIKKIDNNHYVIEMAVAGFDKNELDIMMSSDNGTLTVSSKAIQNANRDDNYLFKGIANRAFSRSFALADTVEVKDAQLINGMLKIYLEQFVKASNTRKIDINDSKPEFLAE